MRLKSINLVIDIKELLMKIISVTNNVQIFTAKQLFEKEDAIYGCCLAYIFYIIVFCSAVDLDNVHSV